MAGAQPAPTHRLVGGGLVRRRRLIG